MPRVHTIDGPTKRRSTPRKPQVGECITLRLERRPIYDNPGYVETARETVKTFEVTHRSEFGEGTRHSWGVRATSGSNKRPMRLTLPMRDRPGMITRGPPGPLRYEIIEILKIGKCPRRRRK